MPNFISKVKFADSIFAGSTSYTLTAKFDDQLYTFSNSLLTYIDFQTKMLCGQGVAATGVRVKTSTPRLAAPRI